MMAINIKPDMTGSSFSSKNKKFVLRTKAMNQRALERGINKLQLLSYIDVFGEEIIDGIEYHAREASRKFDAVPRDERFFKSFYYEIEGEGVAIYSKWEWITKYLNNHEPERMDWLTKQGNSTLSVIPLKDSKGQMIFRTVPLMKNDAWIHPAIKKWTWIEKGVARGINKAINRVLQLIMMKENLP